MLVSYVVVLAVAIYLPDNKWARYLLSGFAIFYGVAMLTLGMGIVDIVWPLENNHWDLLASVAHIDVFYIKIFLSAYAIVFAVIVIFSYRSFRQNRDDIKGN
ncbi:MAG: hypothetical protein NTX14_02550 [Candidatus Nealsonbacteria bacterium]|nr:hypothetical protein [Candidatus Nealsonbacteria bacterium]